MTILRRVSIAQSALDFYCIAGTKSIFLFSGKKIVESSLFILLPEVLWHMGHGHEVCYISLLPVTVFT